MRLDICGHEYTLRAIKDLKKDGTPLWGWYKIDSGEVLMDADQTVRVARNTLIHEIVHGILEHAGYGDLPQNEGIVTAVAYGLESVRLNGKPILKL